jgi:hypothetical protein
MADKRWDRARARGSKAAARHVEEAWRYLDFGVMVEEESQDGADGDGNQ